MKAILDFSNAVRLGRSFFMKLILAAITMAALWGCSNSCSPVDPNRREDPDIVDPDTLPAFVQNDDEWTGFYREDGYEALRKLAYPSKTEMGTSYLVKFVITDFNSDSAVVHFMNTKKRLLHYDFARSVLHDPSSLSEFEKEAYYDTAKNTVAGTLVYYATLDSMVALTFFPTDCISPKQVAAVQQLIESRMLFLAADSSKNRLFYMPSGSAAEKALVEHEAEFKKANVPVYTHAQLFGDVLLQIMNTGTAYGTLVKLTAAELDTAIVSSHDILILETLPAEIPLVAATISKDAQTPLSHVNLAAKARKTPNIAFNGKDLPDSLLALCGKLVKLEVKANSYTVTAATLEEAQAFWKRIAREPITLTYDLSDSGLVDFADLNFNSSKSVGVKASNLAELQKLLPENSPDGFAVPFYHYSNFLNYAQVTEELCEKSFSDCGKEGRASGICTQVKDACMEQLAEPAEAESSKGTASLRSYIAGMIARDDFAADTRLREAVLDNIRYLFKHIPVDVEFGKSLDAKVYELYGDAGVRLRSSTNSEDLADFNGAGLYKSVKATTREKDLPSDEIRKVWASVWSFKAFEERSLWNIDHMSVQMAVAVHEAFPDEVANGVIITQNIADFSVAGIYANVQLGETSITNPEGGERPEILSIIPSVGLGVQSVLLQHSTLSPDALILTDKEINELYLTVQKIQRYFARLYNEYPDAFALDIEFKVMGPERKLIYKQVRPYVM